MVPECEAPHLARGYCNKQRLRWRRYGDPLAPDRRAGGVWRYE